ncbi:MAG: ribonuclease Z [Bacteroidales bacterium]|nr:ribonuclease Z [Bacteroidales bacterium]
MTFSLTVLGSSAAIPANDRNLSAHLLNANERFFLIDCGEGTQFQLRKFHISLQKIRYIFISHLHGDHYFGLIGLLNSMHLLGRKTELHLFGPPRLMEVLDLQMELSLTRLVFPLVFHPLIMDQHVLIHEDDHLSIHSFPLKHAVPTCGFIFREKNPPRKIVIPRSYAYCSDTVYTESIIPYISGVKLLYHESTFMEDLAGAAAEKFHTTAKEAATLAQKAQVTKLLLGHFSARYEDLTPLLEEAKSVFFESYVAQEGTSLEI